MLSYIYVLKISESFGKKSTIRLCKNPPVKIECEIHQSNLNHRTEHIIQPQERAAVDAIPVPLHKFSHVHMDLVGPWICTYYRGPHSPAVDRTTRWAEAIPLQSTTAQVVADSFVASWVWVLGFQLPSQQTRGPSSPVARGSACAEPWASSTCKLLPTTCSPTGWCSAFTSS